MYELKNDVVEVSKLYETKKEELEKIFFEAKKEVEAWKNIITIFNNRFYVPFKVEIENQKDVILKQDKAILEFKYDDNVGEIQVFKDKDFLLSILSKGEQRAYYILQLLFDIETRKLQDGPSLLIFDDIADSFDYKNKYAIIEYIKDLHESNKFKSIILTHNFDFYRTVSSRLGLKRDIAVFMAVKSSERIIKLSVGHYQNDVFSKFIQNYKKPEIFISLIPFVRNIIQYSEGNKSDNYISLTSCLHLKNGSRKITCSDILNIFKSKLRNIEGIDFEEQNIVDFIYQTVQNIISEKNIDEILLENKIVLAIATRLKAEQFMLNSLPNIDSTQITSNQTRCLFDEYKKNISPENEIIHVLDKVNLMTPENIHINAFMYEPLIDMSIRHLIDLYNDVSKLVKNKIAIESV